MARTTKVLGIGSALAVLGLLGGCERIDVVWDCQCSVVCDGSEPSSFSRNPCGPEGEPISSAHDIEMSCEEARESSCSSVTCTCDCEETEEEC